MNLKKKEIKSVDNCLIIIKNNLAILKSRDKVVLGVSGGVDSVFLFFSLLQILDKKQIIIAHINHGLRKEAIGDEKFVVNLAKKYGVTCYVKKIDLTELAKTTKQSLEECGRTERYLFFRELKEKLKAKFILTAHNKDDLAESILLNFARGAFVKGLVGIRKIEADLLRPLLDFSKDEIYQLAKKNQLKWVEDKSNLDPKFKRNFVRHHILKPLKELNPSILEKFERFSSNMLDLNKLLNGLTFSFLDKHKNSFKISDFNAFPEILRKEIIVSIYDKYNKTKEDLSTDFLEEICRFIATAKNNSIHQFGENFLLQKKSDQIILLENAKFEDYEIETLSVSIPEIVKFGDKKIETAEVLACVDFKVKNCYFFYLDGNKVGEKIIIRSWEKGDKFKPLGMTNSKKLQDLFVDLKIAKEERKRIPIFIGANNAIMAVGNLRISQDFRVTKKTKKIIKVSIY